MQIDTNKHIVYDILAKSFCLVIQTGEGVEIRYIKQIELDFYLMSFKEKIVNYILKKKKFKSVIDKKVYKKKLIENLQEHIEVVKIISDPFKPFGLQDDVFNTFTKTSLMEKIEA